MLFLSDVKMCLCKLHVYVFCSRKNKIQGFYSTSCASEAEFDNRSNSSPQAMKLIHQNCAIK